MQKVNPTYVEYDELQHFFISIAGQAASAVTRAADYIFAKTFCKEHKCANTSMNFLAE